MHFLDCVLFGDSRICSLTAIVLHSHARAICFDWRGEIIRLIGRTTNAGDVNTRGPQLWGEAVNAYFPLNYYPNFCLYFKTTYWQSFRGLPVRSCPLPIPFRQLFIFHICITFWTSSFIFMLYLSDVWNFIPGRCSHFINIAIFPLGDLKFL